MGAIFHPEALEEYEDAVHYYAAIQAQLGQRFHDTVEATIDSCSGQPLAYAILENDVRRCLVHAFPYAVLYTVEPDYVLIVAVMHCHREPGYWRHRIRSRL